MLQSPEFWVAVGFVILVAVIARPMLRGITASLDTRAERIANTLAEAARLRDEAQQLLGEYQRKQLGALDEREALLANARAEAANLVREAEARIAAALALREQLALEKIAIAEADAVSAVRSVTVDVAIAATARLIAGRLDEALASTLIDRSVAEIPDKLRRAG